ncbi:MAG: DMT family transporter, partial [Ruminiclostridium sp.]|nr:DMT family transporter [Ruminiclostridium sp.]
WLLPSLCIAGGYIATNIAIVLTTATATAFLRSLSTVMTPLLALVVFRKRFNQKHIPVLLLVVVGLYLLCGRGGLTGFGIGEIFGLLSALLLAGSLVFGEKALDKVDPVALTTVQTAMSVVLTTLCAFLLEGGVHLETAGTPEWLIIIYLAILCTVAGYLLQNAALRSISSRAVALLQCTGPVMTAFFSFLILGERLSLAGLLGAGILLACVVAETLMKDEEATEPEA